MTDIFPEALRRFFGLSTVDTSGAAAAIQEWVPRYREAVIRQHGAFLSSWKAKRHDRALVELHFFLIAVSRVVAFMEMAATHLGDEVKAHVDSRDFGPQIDARNQFEHIEDRLFGSRRNAPIPITEGGATRTVHLGLRSSDQHFTYSNKAVDVSEAFLRDFLEFVDQFDGLVQESAERNLPANLIASGKE